MYGDSHSHLNGYSDDQMARLLAEARSRGVEIVVGVGNTPDTSEATIEVSRRFSGILPAVGIHPWMAIPLDDETAARLRRLASQKEVVAIGEVGIDVIKEPGTRELQWQLFRGQVVLAKELDLPLLVHCKGAGDEVLEELRAQRPVRGVFHGFAGNRAEAEAWIELGFYVGVGVRAVSRNLSADLEDAIRSMPLDAMLLETDSTVRSYTGEEGLQPAAVTEVAERVARIRGCTPEEVGRRTTANLRAMLRL